MNVFLLKSRRQLLDELREQTERAVSAEAELEKMRRRKRYIEFQNVRNYPLDLIQIPSYMTPPRPDNLNACKEFYNRTGALDRALIINPTGYMIDGYIGLLTLQANDMKTWKVIIAKTY